MQAFFISDLHGKLNRIRALNEKVLDESPDAVFIGGDILPPPGFSDRVETFIDHFLTNIEEVKKSCDTEFFIIMGNDDPRFYESSLLRADRAGLINYVHFKILPFESASIFGYSYIPPTPFRLKDFEKYDVSRYTDPGCVPPEEGSRTVERPQQEEKNIIISNDLLELGESISPDRSICLFHSPPYGCSLDVAGLHGKMIDWAPVDIHIGSFAIKRFIEEHQPLITLHGHVHESARLTGEWRERFGRTHSFSAAHDGPELALVRFDTEDIRSANRELIEVGQKEYT